MTQPYRSCSHCGRTPKGSITRGLCGYCYRLWLKDPASVPEALADGRVKGTPKERFLAKIVPGHDACAIWTGARTTGGYGKFPLTRTRSVFAHRFAYELFVGPIPDGMYIDHVCHNVHPTCMGGETCVHRRCMNPRHLRVATPRENALGSRHTMASRLAAGTVRIPQRAAVR